MSQISIGMKNPKKRWAPTAKKATNNIESIQDPVINNRASLQDTSDNIKRLKFWQLVQWFTLVTMCVVGITLLVVVYTIALKQPQQREEILVDIQELRATMDMFENRLIQIENSSLDLVQELNRSVFELKAALEHSSITHERCYRQLNNTIYTVVDSVRTVSPTNELDLTAGCTQIQAACVINQNNVGTPPASAVCETDAQDMDVPGFRNVNIYCYVDNSAGETNPVTSTLNIFNGEVSCLCSLVALVTPTASPECRLTIQRCPNTIRLNTTNMK